MKTVTENDFRKEEFKDKNTEDYEFRADGEIVRKDRWEMGIRRLAQILLPDHRDFEIEEIIKSAMTLKE